MSTTYLPIPAVPAAGPARGLRALIATSAMIGALLLVGSSVFASFNATASNTQQHGISAGTLKLIMTENGTGFGTEVAKIAPGDVIRRFLTLTNTGDLSGKDLKLAATVTPETSPLTDATKGLQVVLTSCSVAWTSLATGGSCSGGTDVLTTSLHALITGPVALTGFSSVGSSVYLRLSVSLPSDLQETTTNGTITTDMVQGKTVGITWMFEETQASTGTSYSG